MKKNHDPAEKHREYRMDRVVKMLNEDPILHLATMTDAESKPGVVIMTIARRGVAVFEAEIPADKYQPFSLIDLIAKYGGAG